MAADLLAPRRANHLRRLFAATRPVSWVVVAWRVTVRYSVSVRDLTIRLPPALKRRLALAAAAGGVSLTHYCRGLLTAEPLGPVEDVTPTAEWYQARVVVSDSRHEVLRVTAARLDVSLNALCVAVLRERGPTENETFAVVFNQE